MDIIVLNNLLRKLYCEMHLVLKSLIIDIVLCLLGLDMSINHSYQLVLKLLGTYISNGLHDYNFR